jgi:mRNA interferase YafQ
MRTPDFTGQFKRDFKKSESRGLDMAKIEAVMALLLADAPLPESYRDHPLRGNWKGYRELHIEPDWLLIYKITGNVVLFARNGTHSELFD